MRFLCSFNNSLHLLLTFIVSGIFALVIGHGSHSWYSMRGRHSCDLIPPSLSAIFDCKKMTDSLGPLLMLSYSHVFLGLWTSDESWCFLGLHLVGKAKVSTLGIIKIVHKKLLFCSALSHRMCAAEVQYACHPVTGHRLNSHRKIPVLCNPSFESVWMSDTEWLLFNSLCKREPAFYHLTFSLIPLSINFMQ